MRWRSPRRAGGAWLCTPPPRRRRRSSSPWCAPSRPCWTGCGWRWTRAAGRRAAPLLPGLPAGRPRVRLRSTRSTCCTTTSGTCGPCRCWSASTCCARCCRFRPPCCTPTTSPPAARVSPPWRRPPASMRWSPSAPTAATGPGPSPLGARCRCRPPRRRAGSTCTPPWQTRRSAAVAAGGSRSATWTRCTGPVRDTPRATC